MSSCCKILWSLLLRVMQNSHFQAIQIQLNSSNRGYNREHDYDYSLTLGACVRGTVVILCVCMCCHASCYMPVLYVETRVPLGFYGIFKIWIMLKTLCSNVLATFADHYYLFTFCERDCDCFVSRRLVYRSIVVIVQQIHHWSQQAINYVQFCARSADLACSWQAYYYTICI